MNPRYFSFGIILLMAVSPKADAGLDPGLALFLTSAEKKADEAEQNPDDPSKKEEAEGEVDKALESPGTDLYQEIK